MSTTAVYVRQSEDKTGAEAAVQRQEAACRLLAEAKGWDSPRLYADNSISATTGKTRPAFEQLIAAIESGAVSAVVVWHLDRLTRSMKDLTRIIEAGQAHRVNIACVHGVSLDLGDPTGVAVAQILTAIAGMEVGHKGRRQREANKQRAEAGEAFWSRRPFGYDRKDGVVITVPAEAAAIQEAAKAILGGATLTSVVSQWNAAGLRTTTKQQGPWGVTQLRRVLMNPRYAGKRLYNGEDKALGKWELILDEETSRRLEEMLTDPRRRTAPDDLNAKYLLSGILVCGKCGRKMFASPYKNKGRLIMIYRCFGGLCMQRRLDLVDEYVEGVTVGILSRPDAAGLFANAEAAGQLRREATDLRDRRDTLASLLADGLMSAASVREQAGKLSKALAEIERAITAAEHLNPAAGVIGAEDVAEAWRELPLANKRQVIRALMSLTVLPAGKGVRFDPEQIQIEWRS
ncbi:recombinase family protein [Pseudarthrobacter oxydans]|uniref:recombinase family protein n=1 Tax=Pseudarthrobacter oxydans TaxID=1671 RepID=UPI0034458739